MMQLPEISYRIDSPTSPPPFRELVLEFCSKHRTGCEDFVAPVHWSHILLVGT